MAPRAVLEACGTDDQAVAVGAGSGLTDLGLAQVSEVTTHGARSTRSVATHLMDCSRNDSWIGSKDKEGAPRSLP